MEESTPQCLQETVRFVDARTQLHELLGWPTIRRALAMPQTAVEHGSRRLLQLGDLGTQHPLEDAGLGHLGSIVRLRRAAIGRATRFPPGALVVSRVRRPASGFIVARQGQWP
ncbi:MAG TPA: hypothetical protein VFA16_19190 [Mycobacterium sp.]|uniref:hypothetical protein n=1 Tax=Mycobacterium sp. TaxID=1785 RepID=UPI002D45370B|nr:hypothetical protein [Mycobacterium sp.]HZU49354.1 hypothetical protein [Mycobacterium sp.]